MGKKSGKAVKAVRPAGPDKADDADLADPGKMAEIIAEQLKTQSGKYGSTPVKPFKPQPEEKAATKEEAEEEAEEELSWIEIELVGEDDEGIAGEKYEVTLPDETVAKGTLDGEGWARIEGFKQGTCKVCFPDLDKEAWEFVRSSGAKSEKK